MSQPRGKEALLSFLNQTLNRRPTMKTKLTDAQKIERIVQRHEDEGWTFYARYSGRCMFGAVCPGIVCPPYDTPKVVTAAKRAGIKAYPSHDSMGRDNIVYWTGIKSDPETVEA